jgi:hypothetical protein
MDQETPQTFGPNFSTSSSTMLFAGGGVDAARR